MTVLQYKDDLGFHTLAFYHVDEMLAFVRVSKITNFYVKCGRFVS